MRNLRKYCTFALTLALCLGTVSPVVNTSCVYADDDEFEDSDEVEGEDAGEGDEDDEATPTPSVTQTPVATQIPVATKAPDVSSTPSATTAPGGEVAVTIDTSELEKNADKYTSYKSLSSMTCLKTSVVFDIDGEVTDAKYIHKTGVTVNDFNSKMLIDLEDSSWGRGTSIKPSKSGTDTNYVSVEKDGYYEYFIKLKSGKVTHSYFWIDKTKPSVTGENIGELIAGLDNEKDESIHAVVKDTQSGIKSITVCGKQYKYPYDDFKLTCTDEEETKVGEVVDKDEFGRIRKDDSGKPVKVDLNKYKVEYTLVGHSSLGCYDDKNYTWSVTRDQKSYDRIGFYYKTNIVVTDYAGNSTTKVIGIDPSGPYLVGVEEETAYKRSQKIKIQDDNELKSVDVSRTISNISKNKVTYSLSLTKSYNTDQVFKDLGYKNGVLQYKCKVDINDGTKQSLDVTVRKKVSDENKLAKAIKEAKAEAKKVGGTVKEPVKTSASDNSKDKEYRLKGTGGSSFKFILYSVTKSKGGKEKLTKICTMTTTTFSYTLKDGTYSFKALDILGNDMIDTEDVVVDTKAPTISGAKKGAVYKEGKSIKISASDAVAGISSITINGKTVAKSSEDNTKYKYKVNNAITKPGAYTVKVTDLVGHLTLCSFRIK